MKRMPVFASFMLFIAICATASYWLLQFWRPPVRPIAAPMTMAASSVSPDAAAGLFGGRPVTAAMATNVQLKGLILADNGTESVAILAIDGKPARAIRVNTEFEPGMIVREVHAQYVLLSENGIVKRVALPEPGRAVQQASFNNSGLLPTASFVPQQATLSPQAYIAPQVPAPMVNPLPGQVPYQQPGLAMPAGQPNQGFPGQMAPGQPPVPAMQPAPPASNGVFLPARPQ